MTRTGAWAPPITVVGVEATAVVDGLFGDRCGDVRAALGEGDAAIAFVSLITAAGLRDVPRFAYVGCEPVGARVLLRGGLVAVVRAADGTEVEVDGRAAATWHESVHSEATEVEVRDADGTPVVLVSLDALPVSARESRVAAPQPSNADEAEVAPVEAELEPADGESPPLPSSVPITAELTILPPREDDEGSVPPPERIPAFESSDSEEVDLSHLFETRHVGVEAAAVRVDEPAAPPAAAGSIISGVPGVAVPPVDLPGQSLSPPAVEAGDHDGFTVGPQALASLRAGLDVTPPANIGPPGPTVPAVRCPLGHLNAPHSDVCRTCGQQIMDREVQVVPRPSVGHLRFDNGLVVDVDRPLLVGRRPTTEGHTGEVPGLVVLPDPDGLLSRIHLEVRLEGWEVLVVDRDSLNGTIVTIPGQEPLLLRPLEPFLISAGTAIDLAGSLGCTFGTDPR